MVFYSGEKFSSDRLMVTPAGVHFRTYPTWLKTAILLRITGNKYDSPNYFENTPKPIMRSISNHPWLSSTLISVLIRSQVFMCIPFGLDIGRGFAEPCGAPILCRSSPALRNSLSLRVSQVLEYTSPWQVRQEKYFPAEYSTAHRRPQWGHLHHAREPP